MSPEINKSRNKQSRAVLIPGEKIALRRVCLSDVNKNYLRWMNDSRVNQYLESRFKRWSPGSLRRYVAGQRRNPDNLFLAIISKDGDRHIGNIKLGPINHQHKSADVGIIIGERAYWGKGLATEAIILLVNYAFKQLKLRKLTAGAYSNNPASIKAFQSAGFLIEGRRRGQYLFKGSYVDQVLMGIARR